MQGMTMDIGDTVENPSMMDSEEDLVPSLQVTMATAGNSDCSQQDDGTVRLGVSRREV